jgi:WD40 repeat protein
MPILLAAGSWDCTIRIWQINESGTVEPKAMQNVGAPILAIDWTDVNSGLLNDHFFKQGNFFRMAQKYSSQARINERRFGIWHRIS